MITSGNFIIFLSAAFLLAIAPGPGMLYVLARSLKGGKKVGMASSFGTALGGMGHVIAAALGLSAILAPVCLCFSVRQISWRGLPGLSWYPHAALW